MTGTGEGDRPSGDTTLFEAGPGLHDAPVAALDDDGFETRYEMGSLLGEGGMGEVRLCTDQRIGREVAMKLVHPDRQSSERLRASFLQEARIQGRLEHPAIVPVHDLGEAPGGGLYFTMRRVHGMTMDAVISLLRAGDAQTTERWTRRRLLNAYGSICSAIEFAHDQGVVHRDLKPSNVILGDFGESYVIDWGCAVLQEPEAGDGRSSTPSDLAGTPGFMAPELLQTVRPGADARADVYALGAMLFELLTLEPLHPRGDRAKTLESTRRGADARPSVRAPQRDIAPELDEICVRATARDPGDRYATAGELAAAIDAYLEGDRDVAARRRLADEAAQDASEAARRALEGTDHGAHARHDAMQAVTRALALDPDNALARQTMMRLIMEPPRELPPRALAEIQAQQGERATHAAKSAGLAYLLWIAFIPLVAWMGIRDLPLVAVAVGIMVAASAFGFVVVRMRPSRLLRAYVLLVVSTLGVAVLSRILGPFILIPSIAAVNTLCFALVVVPRARLAALLFGLASFIGPLCLEWLGVLPASYRFEDGVMTVLPQMASLPGLPTAMYLLMSNVMVIITGYIIVTRLRGMLEDAERRVMLHAWHLRMLVEDRPPA